MVVRQMVVDAVLLEGRSVREVAASFGVSKSFVAKMVGRFREGGTEALEPHSRAHRHDPQKSPPAMEERIVSLRKELADFGVDHGAATIQVHLEREVASVPSVSTIHRILVRRGFVTPQPKKRPKSSFIRFEADQPNEMWQSDFTEWLLTDGTKVEILNFLDDHSRLLLASRALRVVKGPDVISTFLAATERWGVPAAMLTDNGAVYNAISRQGRTAFESLLGDLGVTYKHGRPYHPQTQGKMERWHRTLKLFLAKHPARSLRELQSHLDDFATYYNEVRPHRAAQRRTPAERYGAREKAVVGPARPSPHYRVRRDVVDPHGKVSLRYKGKMLHLNVGYAHRGQKVVLHVVDEHVRVLTSAYKLIGEATLNPTQSYQPVRRPT
ncbi:MAG: IS481 family transposase [Acidobacteriota bacterium]|nr:IS481 family transposase [Acidobacteriota bacterium]MDE3083185.1 IS481 family transposase [Acidobacteriota bacterium]